MPQFNSKEEYENWKAERANEIKTALHKKNLSVAPRSSPERAALAEDKQKTNGYQVETSGPASIFRGIRWIIAIPLYLAGLGVGALGAFGFIRSCVILMIKGVDSPSDNLGQIGLGAGLVIAAVALLGIGAFIAPKNPEAEELPNSVNDDSDRLMKNSDWDNEMR